MHKTKLFAQVQTKVAIRVLRTGTISEHWVHGGLAPATDNYLLVSGAGQQANRVLRAD
jgi:hypothetical protein